MFVHRVLSKGKNGKIYRSVLLRQNTRVGNKVHTETLANLTRVPTTLVAALERAVAQHRVDSLDALPNITGHALQVRKGDSFGGVWAVSQVAQRLGITKALGVTFAAELLLWQVLARVLRPGTSLLAMVRLAANCAAAAVLKWSNAFTEDDLYKNGSWAAKRQDVIERRLWQARPEATRQDRQQLFLYDVTSSYLEGTHNVLGDFGYNRDGKQGKQQLVVGLLTDHTGEPCSVRVYRGNTRDTNTFADQIHKVKRSFGCEGVTMVGDRGMIRSEQIQQAKAAKFHYISALTKPQIKKLIHDGVFQMELFDEDLGEVQTEDTTRYVLRRNPVRQLEIARSRLSKKASLEKAVTKSNAYLAAHPRAKAQTQHKMLSAKVEQLKVDAWLRIEIVSGEMVLHEDANALKEIGKLDGCYVIVTDLPSDEASKDVVHDRYKSLAQVEQDFRTLKLAHLEIRPWYVVKEDNTHAHAISSLLALKIRRYLQRAWFPLDITVEEGLRKLEEICVTELVDQASGQVLSRHIPVLQADSLEHALLQALHLKLPSTVPSAKVRVGTRVNIASRRKPLQ